MTKFSYILVMREIVDEYKDSLSKRIRAGSKDFEFHDEFNKVKTVNLKYFHHKKNSKIFENFVIKQ